VTRPLSEELTANCDETVLGAEAQVCAVTAPDARALGPTACGGSAAEEVDQLVTLAFGQAADCLR
jgi:hypothetical protein